MLESTSYRLLEAGFFQLFEPMRREGKSLSQVMAEAGRQISKKSEDGG